MSQTLSVILTVISSVSTIALVVLTALYTYQTKKQAKYAHEVLLETKKQTENQNIHDNNVRKNIAYLINGDMFIDQTMYVNYSYYKTLYPNDNSFNSLLDHFDKNKTYFWDSLQIDAAKYFSSELIQELVGYYIGIKNLYSLEYNEKQKLELIKGQLSSMYKCIGIMESELGINLRTQESFKVDGYKVTVNEETGDLIKEKIK